MTPKEFGAWLSGRVQENAARSNDRFHSNAEYERAYAREDEADEIYNIWLNVDWGQEWRPNPASIEGTRHSESSPTQPRTPFQDVTLPEPESPETT